MKGRKFFSAKLTGGHASGMHFATVVFPFLFCFMPFSRQGRVSSLLNSSKLCLKTAHCGKPFPCCKESKRPAGEPLNSRVTPCLRCRYNSGNLTMIVFSLFMSWLPPLLENVWESTRRGGLERNCALVSLGARKRRLA